MKSILFFILILFIKVEFLSTQSISPKIIGGRDADENEFPYMVSIRRTEIEMLIGVPSHICGGVIINSNTIVIAAHCLFDRFGNILTEPNSFTVVSGILKIWSQYPYPLESSHLAININKHPQFNPETFQNDISTMQVYPDFDFSLPNVQPIKIDFNQTYHMDSEW